MKKKTRQPTVLPLTLPSQFYPALRTPNRFPILSQIKHNCKHKHKLLLPFVFHKHRAIGEPIHMRYSKSRRATCYSVMLPCMTSLFPDRCRENSSNLNLTSFRQSWSKIKELRSRCEQCTLLSQHQIKIVHRGQVWYVNSRFMPSYRIWY